MSTPLEFNFRRYLAAKKDLDDRSLNRPVFRTLYRALARFPATLPLQILEVGCGLGTMVERLLDWRLLNRHAVYTAIDLLPENISAARERLRLFAVNRGFRVTEEAGVLSLGPGPGRGLKVILEAVDLYDFLQRERGRRSWDLLLAHAFLDLVALPTTLPPLLSLLRPGGLCYFTLNFDGATVFLPAVDEEFDRLVEELYHRVMDRRLPNSRPGDHSRTGRRLFQALKGAGARVLAAGASDWVVHPGAKGYPGDEAYFLHFIIQTVATALEGQTQLAGGRFRDWVAERHRQIERGELIYLARQLDFLGVLFRSQEDNKILHDQGVIDRTPGAPGIFEDL